MCNEFMVEPCKEKCVICNQGKRKYKFINQEEITHCKDCKEKGMIAFKDPCKWTIDRRDNTLPHTKKNCFITCLSCNISRRDREIRV